MRFQLETKAAACFLGGVDADLFMVLALVALWAFFLRWLIRLKVATARGDDAQ